MTSIVVATNSIIGSLLIKTLSSLNTFVERIKLYFINDPSTYSDFLFDFHIRLDSLEAPAVPNSSTQYIGGSIIKIHL